MMELGAACLRFEGAPCQTIVETMLVWARADAAIGWTSGDNSPFWNLITYEAQLPAAGGRWQGFRRLRDDLSGRIDRRFALSNDPPTAIDHHVRPQAELRT